MAAFLTYLTVTRLDNLALTLAIIIIPTCFGKLNMDIVQEVLLREQQALAKFKPISVDKHLAVENDLGLLLCVDPNDLDEKQMK